MFNSYIMQNKTHHFHHNGGSTFLTAIKRIKANTDQVLNTFNTPFARFFNVFMIILIIISTIIFVLDTIPELDFLNIFFSQLEAVVAIIFTFEYVLRVWVAPRPKHKYIFSLFSIFDLAAIVPFYFGYLPLGFLRTFRMLRMLRVLRVLRLLKLSRHLTSKLSDAEKQANAFRVEMQILAIGFVTVWLIFSGIMYAVENPASTKGFESVPSTMWYVIVTITTVGYGDVYPGTALGKIIAGMIMLSGIGVLGTLTGIIGKAMMAKLSINTETLEGQPVSVSVDDDVDNLEIKSCSNDKCNDVIHHKSAKFCKTCGAELIENTKTSEPKQKAQEVAIIDDKKCLNEKCADIAHHKAAIYCKSCGASLVKRKK
jgi:voltage-gated potassium channel